MHLALTTTCMGMLRATGPAPQWDGWFDRLWNLYSLVFTLWIRAGQANHQKSMDTDDQVQLVELREDHRASAPMLRAAESTL